MANVVAVSRAGIDPVVPPPPSASATTTTHTPRTHQPAAGHPPPSGVHRLSPSTVGSMYPALEHLQRISHGHAPLPPPSSQPSGSRVVTSQPVSTPDRLSGLSPLAQPSQPVNLPSYQQARSPRTPQVPLDASLPDLLHSHLLPPPQQPPIQPHRPRHRTRRDTDVPAPGVAVRTRRSRHQQRPRHRSQSSSSSQDGMCKEPCVKCVVTVTSFRWVLVVLSVLGVCCVVTGIVLAALHAAGSSFLFLAIMFIGLGILLVVVVGMGWKCTPRGHEPLHALFGIGTFRSGQTRERRPHRRHRHRDGNWAGGVLYPEFQYRRPPPSYAASMHDYQRRAENVVPSETTTAAAVTASGDHSLPNSPPPSYRSRTSTMHTVAQDTPPTSRPPTYRSRAPSRRPSLPREDNDPGGLTVDPGPEAVGPLTDPGSVSPDYPGAHDSPGSSSVPPGATSDVAPSAVTLEVPHSTSTPPPPTNTAQPPSSSISSSTTDRPPSSTTHIPADQPVAGVSRPSGHSRMESEDRIRLEQALQSLDEASGIVNHGAILDDSDVDTHL